MAHVQILKEMRCLTYSRGVMTAITNTRDYLTEAVAKAFGEFENKFPGRSVSDIVVDIRPRPHKQKGLMCGRMAVYCFFLNGQTLKIGIAGPRSDARFRSQHYNPRSAGSTLAGSLIKYPAKAGISDIQVDSIGDWIRAQTDRMDILLPADWGRQLLCRLESFLHLIWNPVYEGVIVHPERHFEASAFGRQQRT